MSKKKAFLSYSGDVTVEALDVRFPGKIQGYTEVEDTEGQKKAISAFAKKHKLDLEKEADAVQAKRGVSLENPELFTAKMKIPVVRKAPDKEVLINPRLAPQFETEEMKKMGFKVRYEEVK